METRNRNILLIALGALVLVCCCCALWSGTLLALLVPRTYSSQPQVSQVVVEIATPVAVEETATPEAPAQTRPVESTPVAVTATAAGVSGTAPATAPAGAATSVLTGTVGSATSGVSAEVALAQATIPAADERALAERLKPGVGDIPVTVNPTPPSYEVGDKISFWVENGQTQVHRQISATLQYVTPHVYEWVEDGIQTNLNDIKRSADLFESKTYPTDREFFGSEWTPGMDNDVHLSILYANELGGGIAAYYSSADEVSHLVNRYSNEKEMFYVAAVDGQTRSSSSFDDGVLAHEFQHMIHWYQDPQEDAWVNEGMSDLAMHLNGFDVGGAGHRLLGAARYPVDDLDGPQRGQWQSESLRRFLPVHELLLGPLRRATDQGCSSFKEAGHSRLQRCAGESRTPGTLRRRVRRLAGSQRPQPGRRRA